MINSRRQFIARCSVSDVECLDASLVALCERVVVASSNSEESGAVGRAERRWPPRGHACDFCGTWSSFVTRCAACLRWLGLADCECAAERCRRAGGVPGQTIVVSASDDGGDRFVCRWCDADAESSESPPPSIGHSRGLLRRVVFVLEPTPGMHMGGWQFRVAHWLAEALLAETGLGTVLVYGLPCGAGEEAWSSALALVQQFALEPRATHC